MQNGDVVKIFEELADLLEIQNANPFRVRAYRNAARTLGDLPESLAEIAGDPARNLEDLPGIGHDLAEKIKTIVTTSSLPQLDGAQRFDQRVGDCPDRVPIGSLGKLAGGISTIATAFGGRENQLVEHPDNIVDLA